MATLPNGRESAAGVDEHTAMLMFQQSADIAARVALGNGLDPHTVAFYLRTLSDAIADPGSVAEDMSPIVVHTC